jgi:membrane protein DedA with SNARE-associated domain
VVEQIWHLLHHHDLLALLGLLTVEESGVPVPVPGDVVMMYAGYRVHLGQAVWYQALLCGVIATLVGSCILYNIGRRGGRPLLKKYGRYLHLSMERQARIEGWLGRYGGLAVFGGRLIPGMRCSSSFVAGTFGVRFPTFILATAASATVWWSLFLYLGSQLGRRFAPIVEGHPYSIFIFLGGAALFSLVPLYVHFRRSREPRVPAIADAPMTST